MLVALVTGGGKGIGKILCESLAKLGYAVIINYNTSEKEAKLLQKDLTEKGAVAIAYKCNIANADEVRGMFAFVKNEFGHLDVLINNAGISRFNTITDITDSEWDDMISVNLSGTFYACRESAKLMIERKSGKIINISSMWGIQGASCECHYSASKSGVIGLTKALAMELAPSGITVNAIAPGAIDTDMMKMLSNKDLKVYLEEVPLGKIGSPNEVVLAVNYILDSNYLTGQVISPNGGVVI